jgi:import receptor subunit TOM70
MSAWSSLTGFVERNRTAALVTAVIFAAGTGAGIYYVLKTQESLGEGLRIKSAERSVSPEIAVGEKKKSKKKSKKKKTDVNASPAGTVFGFSVTRDSAKAPEYPVIEDMSVVDGLAVEQKKHLASLFKTAGNHVYNEKNYNRAIELYGSAIGCDGTDPIFFSNRAACYNALQQYDKVIEDTTKALDLKPDYVKCLSRRAVAHEKLEQYSDSILDFTAACILGDFQDKSLNNAVDRVLKLHAEKIVADEYIEKPRTLPSANFVAAYLNSFRARALPEDVENAEQGTGDYDIKLAVDALGKETAESYEQASELFESAVKKNAKNIALAYEYRGTFRFLMNDIDGALEDIEKSIELQPSVQAYIKRSSIHMERANINSANLDFENALKLDANSPDVYYHRAQIAFLTQDFNAAIKDYEKSIELDNDFMYAPIQLAVAQYRMGSSAAALDSFRRLLSNYSNSSDVHNYYGEILMDQQSFDQAIKEFDVAIELEKNKGYGTVNVLPLVNKSLAVFQLHQDVAQAESLCRKAVTLDPLSDIAIGTLAQFCLQQNKTEDALELFSRNADIARTDAERIQSLSFREAARTQLRIINERPALRQRLEALTRQGR